MPTENPFKRNVAALRGQTFDLLVIGGGINGAGIAWDAALRGLKVALIDKADIGGGASAGCFKIVHGGLRYLQHMELSRLRESVREQRILRLIAPHLVWPFPFLIPCYGFGKRGRWFLRLGMIVYELLARNRNAGLEDTHVLPNHRVLSKKECLEAAPGLSKKGLRGGIVYYDCQMSNCERLTLSVARAAARYGAVVCNYVHAESVKLKPEDKSLQSINGVRVCDLETGSRFTIKAGCVVNATGPWLRKTLTSMGLEKCVSALSDKQYPFSKGIQVVVPQFVSKCGLAIESMQSDSAAVVSRGGRSFFAFPWRGVSLIGTSDTVSNADPDSFTITPEESESFLQEVRDMYDSCDIDTGNQIRNEIRGAFGGFRPIDHVLFEKLERGGSAEQPATVSREDRFIIHDQPNKGGICNLISVEGVKYTTFRGLASRVVDKIIQSTPLMSRKARTQTDVLPGGDVGNYTRFSRRVHRLYDAQLTPLIVDYLIRNYGSDVEDIFRLIAANKDLASVLTTEPPCLRAEIVYMARREMACRLSDVVLRRSGFGLTGYPGEHVLQEAAILLASELDWPQSRVEDEVQQTKEDYRKMGIIV